ncbi:MAG: purine permease [Lachnospiraceae bacterium]|nr:purine permease [Candidatus Equihabitans merdae]
MAKERNYTSPYDLDGMVPLKQAVPFGLQQVLSMFASNLTAPLIILGVMGVATGSDFQLTILRNASFVSGFVTMVQLIRIWKIGGKLPLVMGTECGVLGVYIAMVLSMGGGEVGYGALLGACIVGGLVEVVIGIFFKKIQKFFPPLVVGIVLTAVGISLMSVGVNMFCGGDGAADYGSWQNLLLAFITLITVIIFNLKFEGFLSNISVLLGLIVGSIAAVIMNIAMPGATGSWVMDWSVVQNAGWFALPALLPVKITFHLKAIVPIAVLFVVLTMETIGSVTSVVKTGVGREVRDYEIPGALFADGLGSSMAACFGVLPNTVFTQNIGITNATRVVNRYSMGFGALVLILAGLCPKLMAVISIIPTSVLGGAVAMMFGMILVSALELVSQAGFTKRNGVIIAVSFGVAYGLGDLPGALSGLPVWFTDTIGSSGVLVLTVTAFVLNIILPTPKGEEPKEIEQPKPPINMI